jgi:tRNA threonylcarbamoyladenosine biosynthesis protein TsaB
MLKLAIDTTSASGSFALAEDDELLFEKYFKVMVTHSETLMPSIDAALKSLNRKVEEIGRIIICNGPGSFTGIRIGLATAKGISYGLQIPLIAFNSLELNAVNLYGSRNPILSFVDARMKEVYAALYTPDLSVIIQPQNRKPEEFLELITEPVTAVGSGLREYSELLKRYELVEWAPLHLQTPKASGLFTLDLLNLGHEVYNLEELFELESEYLRLSQAELARKQ